MHLRPVECFELATHLAVGAGDRREVVVSEEEDGGEVQRPPCQSPVDGLLVGEEAGGGFDEPPKVKLLQAGLRAFQQLAVDLDVLLDRRQWGRCCRHSLILSEARSGLGWR